MRTHALGVNAALSKTLACQVRTPILIIIIEIRSEMISSATKSECVHRAHTRKRSWVIWIHRHRCCCRAHGSSLQGPHSGEKFHFVVISIVSRFSNRIALHCIAIELIVIALASLEICRWIQLTHGWRGTWMLQRFEIISVDFNLILKNILLRLSAAAYYFYFDRLLRAPSLSAVHRPRIQLQLRASSTSDVVDNVNVAHYYRHFDAK